MNWDPEAARTAVSLHHSRRAPEGRGTDPVEAKTARLLSRQTTRIHAISLNYPYRRDYQRVSRQQGTGICHICGNVGELSFEHVPPRAAFNDRRVITVNFEEAIKLGPEEMPQGPVQQRGAGAYTLCPSCNNRMGSWYGLRFVAWCYQAMALLSRCDGNPSLVYLHYLFPLAILKQIVTMFFSVNSAAFRSVHPELVRVVLNREAKYLPPQYRFFVYYNTTGRMRFNGLSATVNLFADGRITLLSEITYPPVGDLMTLDSDPPDHRLFEITHFARDGYHELQVMDLRLPVLPTYTSYPGDYRTTEEISEQAAANRAQLSNATIGAAH